MMVAAPGLRRELFSRGLGACINCGQSPGTSMRPFLVAGAPVGCPLLSDGTCGDPESSYDCSLVRECDQVTGTRHFEYTLPSGPVPNANIWSLAADGTYVWLGPNGTPATPPAGMPPPDSSLPTGQSAAGWFGAWQNQKQLLTTPPPVNTPPPAGGGGGNQQQQTTKTTDTSGNGSGQNNSTNSLSNSTLITGVPDIAVYAGLALAAFMFFKK